MCKGEFVLLSHFFFLFLALLFLLGGLEKEKRIRQATLICSQMSPFTGSRASIHAFGLVFRDGLLLFDPVI